MSEQRFRSALTAKLRHGGAMVTNVEDRAGAGFPDITAVLAGEVKFIEAKFNKNALHLAPRFDVRASQVRWLREAWAKGASAWLLIKMREGHVYRVRGCDAHLAKRVLPHLLGKLVHMRTCRELWEELQR